MTIANNDRSHRRSLLAVAVLSALLAPAVEARQDEAGPGYSSAAQKFFDEGTLTGGLYFFQRDRERIEGGDAGDGKYHSNLSHATTQAALRYNSGYAWDMVGIELGGHAAYDLAIDESNPVNEENEFSFQDDKWGNQGGDADTTADGGGSISNAALRLKNKDGSVTFKAGYSQINVPGIMGVNWSYQPGTYEGVQIEGNFDKLYLTAAWADKYKAPWFKEVQHFSSASPYAADNLDSVHIIDYIYGLAARYTFDQGTILTLGYGQSEGYMDSYHLKAAHKFDWMGGFNTSYQFYGSETQEVDGVDDYDGLAWQQAITTAWASGPYSFRAEGLWTKAEGELGNYLPRLTRGYANSQGANEIWWDSRSDWNANNEKAIFFGTMRAMDDLFGAPGWSMGVSAAYGWDAEYTYGNNDLTGGEEWAFNFDILYTVQDGKMKGTTFKLHYTDYNNQQDELGSWAYPNMFTSEHDVKFHIIVPVTLI